MMYGAIIYQIIYSTEDAAPAASFSIRISNPNPKTRMPGKVWEHKGRLSSGEKLVRGGIVPQIMD